MRNELWAWGWEPAWALCSADDDDDGGSSSSAGDDDGGGAGAGAGDDDSGSGHEGSGGSSGGGGGAGESGGGGGGGAGAGGGGGGGAGAGGGGSDGGSGSDTSSAATDDGGGSEGSGDTTGSGAGSGSEGSGDTTGASPGGGVSSDAGSALDAAGPASTGIGAAAGALGVGVGGVASAEDVLSGLDSPVAQALSSSPVGASPMGIGPGIGANAFGANETVMPLGGPNSYDPSLTQGSPVGTPVAKDQSQFGTPSAVANLDSPFGASPSTALGVQSASGISSLDNLAAIGLGQAPGAPAAPATLDSGWGPTPVNNDITDPYSDPGQIALGMTDPNAPAALSGGLPGGVTTNPEGGPNPVGLGDQTTFPTALDAGQRIASMDAAGGFGPAAPSATASTGAPPGGTINPSGPSSSAFDTAAFPTGPIGAPGASPSVAGGPPASSSPSASPSGPGAVAGTPPSTAPGASQGPSTVTDTAAVAPGPGTSTSADVAAALAGADGGGGSDGSGSSGSTLAEQITAPIPGHPGGSPPAPVETADDGGNYNPEGGIYGNPSTMLPGGVPGAPSIGGGSQAATVDGSLTVGNTPEDGPPEGNYNAGSGLYDALNNA